MRLTAANQAITPASMWSVLSSRPMPSAKRRTARGLSRVTGKPRAHSKAKGCFSYPPVASMATSSTPCCWQKAANSAQPSGLLGKERVGPWGPIPASREKEETSTPQIILATVTCLVRAMEVWRTVRSCVTAAAVPKLPRGGCQRVAGALRRARGSRSRTPRLRHFHHNLSRLTRYKGCSPDFLSLSPISHLPYTLPSPYPASPLFAALTKTPGVWGYSSHLGTSSPPKTTSHSSFPSQRGWVAPG